MGQRTLPDKSKKTIITDVVRGAKFIGERTLIVETVDGSYYWLDWQHRLTERLTMVSRQFLTSDEIEELKDAIILRYRAGEMLYDTAYRQLGELGFNATEIESYLRTSS